ncbi:MAG: hypothetical protein ACPGU1_10345 [Myxococcota bacterium]
MSRWTTEFDSYVSWIASKAPDDVPVSCPADDAASVAIVTLHDGAYVPQRILDAPRLREVVDKGELERSFDVKRDWGASLVSGHLAAALGTGGFHRVDVSRLVMDFNRFPGSTPRNASHMDKFAISGYLARDLDYVDKRWVLDTLYDGVSGEMDRVISDKQLVVSIHTYDERNSTETQRPEVSILGRSHSYQQHSRLPFGLFDPLFPDVLAESAVRGALRDRIALTLEKSGVFVEHNYPYCLPDGSLEIRCQPWFFFHRLRAHYELTHADTADDPAHRLVWRMLQNTNLRCAEANALSGYLHHFRDPLPGRRDDFERSRLSYEAIRDHLRAHEPLVHAYRFAHDRTSALTIEVRKDLVWRFDDEGRALGPRDDAAREIATLLAQGIGTYLREDRRACRVRLG